jgi:hypothetical protein
MKNSYFSEEPFSAGPEKRALKAVLVNNKNNNMIAELERPQNLLNPGSDPRQFSSN